RQMFGFDPLEYIGGVLLTSVSFCGFKLYLVLGFSL
ncbi:unnamed protein product, partial [marine sediment metagenome]